MSVSTLTNNTYLEFISHELGRGVPLTYIKIPFMTQDGCIHRARLSANVWFDLLRKSESIEDYDWFSRIWSSRTWFDEIWTLFYSYQDARESLRVFGVQLSRPGEGIKIIQRHRDVLQNNLNLLLED